MERRRWTFGAYAAGVAVVVWVLDGWWLNRGTVDGYLVLRRWLGADWLLPEHVGIAANVVLFVPLGLFAARWSALRLVGLAGVSALTIEGVQWVVGHRQAELVDVAANVGGAVVGWALARAYVSLRARKPPPTNASRNS